MYYCCFLVIKNVDKVKSVSFQKSKSDPVIKSHEGILTLNGSVGAVGCYSTLYKY